MHLEDNALSGSGACALSGNSNGPFVVTDFQIDPRYAHGRAYVNATVAREIGEAAGCVRPETYESVLSALAATHLEIEQLRGDLAQTEGENEALSVFVGGKLGAKANHIRKEAGFKGRRAFDEQRDFINGDTPIPDHIPDYTPAITPELTGTVPA